MKKPTLRMRQVFEHPTHFKVTRPLGNPIKIAKQGLSPNLMSRLRKYADGTPDEPVLPPTEDEAALVEQMKAQALAPAGGLLTSQIPVSPGQGSFGDPPLPVGAESPDLEIPAPVVAPITPVAQPVSVAPVAAPAQVVAAPTQVAVTPVAATPVVAAAPAAVAEPVAAKPPEPTLEERRKKFVDEYMAEFEAQEAKRIEDQNNLIDRFAKINQEAEVVAQNRLVEAKQIYAKQQAALTEFESEKPMTGGDIARSIGSALSVALGAFASGMTGIPNFAMKIYEDGLARDLQRQREQRNSLVKQMEMAGLSVEEAEKLYRAQKDKEFAARMEAAASTIRNPKTRDEALKAANTLANKALIDEADIATKQAKAYESTEKAKLATEQAKAIQPELELKGAEQLRKLEKDRQDAIQAVLDRASREKMKQAEIDAQIMGINKKYAIDAATLGLKAKETELPAGIEGASQYDQLQAAFKAEGTKGLAKKVSQTFRVDGINLLARSEPEARSYQTLFRNLNSSKDTLDKLIKEVGSMKAWDSLGPTDRYSAVKSLAAKFAVAFPKSENFNRALSVADKDVVLDEIIQNPTSFWSWAFGQTKSSLNAFKEALEEEKVNQLKDAAVEGDPNLARLVQPSKEAKYGAKTAESMAGRE
jgi:hypothetical protein